MSVALLELPRDILHYFIAGSCSPELLLRLERTCKSLYLTIGDLYWIPLGLRYFPLQKFPRCIVVRPEWAHQVMPRMINSDCNCLLLFSSISEHAG